jgi:hypothetical protein
VVKRPSPKSRRKHNRHPVLIGFVIVGIVLGVGLYEAALLSAKTTPYPPYPCITGESSIHVHPYLRIVIEWQNVTIPSQVGFFSGGSCLMPIHTHDASGTLHIELSSADANQNFTLGDFFRIWNATPGMGTLSFGGSVHPVTFSATDILGFVTDSSHKVVVLVDNSPVSNPSTVLLEQLDYCSAANSAGPPCYPTAAGDPLWNGGSTYPFKTGHTIVIEYVKT